MFSEGGFTEQIIMSRWACSVPPSFSSWSTVNPTGIELEVLLTV
jgi:hypothetical protein